MFGWFKKLGADEVGLGKMTRELERMIQEGRHMFDTASNVLLAGTDPTAVREELFRTDQKINRMEQQIRREIIVHGSVHGSDDLPELMVLMSVSKDAERIGDYAKNLFGIALDRRIAPGSPHHAELLAVKEKVSALLSDAPDVYSTQDKPGAEAFLKRAQATMSQCDKHVTAILRSNDGGGLSAASVLAFRHMKRVAGHIQNIVTAVLVPVDKLDFLDEPLRHLRTDDDSSIESTGG
jgi:phosphate uptake regulator